MDLPKDWVRLQSAFEEEEYWRRQGEFAIRSEMERRLTAYFEKKAARALAGVEATITRADRRAQAAQKSIEKARAVAEAIRAGRVTPPPVLPPLLPPKVAAFVPHRSGLSGNWMNRQNANRVARGLPRIGEENAQRRKAAEEEKVPWQRRSR